MSKKKALGRGLNALLGDSSGDDRLETDIRRSGQGSGLADIELDRIEMNPFQPRTHFDASALKELADSIRVHGIIQPVTVRKLAPGKYQLISGERRLQAARAAGLKAIPSFIRTADDQLLLEMSLIENIQRENLNAMEIALSYQRLITECKLKQEELGQRVGKNRATVTNYLRLLKLPPDVQVAVRDNKITMGHARALIGLENAAQQLQLLNRIIRNDMSVRQVEEIVRTMTQTRKPKKTRPTPPASEREIRQLQSKLSSHFGTRVVVKTNGRRGEIRLPFLSIDDLNRILAILKVS